MVNIDQTFIESQYDQISETSRLGKAILIQSLVDVSKGHGPEYESAMEYIFDDNIKYPYSFLNVCRLLNLSFRKIREAVKSGSLVEAMAEYKKLQQSYGHHFDKVIGL